MSLLRKTLFLLWIITLYSCSDDFSYAHTYVRANIQSSDSDTKSEKSVSKDYPPRSPEMSSAEKLYRHYTSSGVYSGRNIQRSSSVLDEAHSHAAARLDPASAENCNNDDLTCLIMASNDRLGLEAIRSLHRQLDDDANGAVDLSESVEFLREELQYEDGAEKRQRAFHRNDDMHISVKELWDAWLRSEVHNWTVEQTTEWLTSNVELPQYVPLFIVNKVTGATLPRLAVSNMQYLSTVLGIKDPIHKQKIALKAMDVVLFGPPKDMTHHLKDLILVTLLLGALIGCWYAYRQNKNSRRHLRRMMKDMESLHKAELALENLQKELERARQEQEYATTEKKDLERRLQQQQRVDGSELRTSYSDLEVSQLKAEIEMLRTELQRAEGELEDRCWSPPVGLQQWLQLTHEIENKAYVKKKVAAEKQLQQAREACEKLRKKRSSLVGAFVSTHGKTIDDVDRSIIEARTALNEVTQELAERVHRWKQIEMMCGFNIINNSGLAVLESVLYRNTANGRGLGLRGRMSSQDDLDDDASSYSPSTDKNAEIQAWKDRECADSSESDKLDLDDDDMKSTSSVQFTVGSSDQDESTVGTAGGAKATATLNRDDSTASGVSSRAVGCSYSKDDMNVSFASGMSVERERSKRELASVHSRSDIFNKSSRMSRSYSQDIQPEPLPGAPDFEPQSPPVPKLSHSETNLEAAQSVAPPPRMRRAHAGRSSARSLVETAARSTVDEETYSTDSNSVAEEPLSPPPPPPVIEKKTKKHKLHFPKFSRKSRTSPPTNLPTLPTISSKPPS